ncbi:MAG: GGDEF domain-containing protein [Microthrixaceae bacterium]
MEISPGSERVRVTVTVAAIASASIAAALAAVAPRSSLPLALATGTALGILVTLIGRCGFDRPADSTLRHERECHRDRVRELAGSASRHEILDRFADAMELADTEEEALDLAARALATAIVDRDHSILLAAPTSSLVQWRLPVERSGIGIPDSFEPHRCNALAYRHTVEVRSTRSLDTCPHLRATNPVDMTLVGTPITMDREPPDAPDAEAAFDSSSTCVPIRMGNRHLGVVTSMGAVGDLPTPEERRVLETVARRLGQTIAVLRGDPVTEHDGEADPIDDLTGLTGRVAMVQRLAELDRADAVFSVAMCDLDGFAAYNSEFGRPAGDDALRLYAELLSDSLRPGDLIARLGGDRFIALLPGCPAAGATGAMERVREALALRLRAEGIAPFTSSVGLVDSRGAATVQHLLEAADDALATAKRAGGNRVVRHGHGNDHPLYDGSR